MSQSTTPQPAAYPQYFGAHPKTGSQRFLTLEGQKLNLNGTAYKLVLRADGNGETYQDRSQQHVSVFDCQSLCSRSTYGSYRMTKTFTANIEISIRQLDASEDYDGDILFQGFRTACDDNTILSFTKYFGFMPLVDISEIYMEDNLYEFLISSPEKSVDGLLEEYFESVMDLIEEKLDGGDIKHINTDYDWAFLTSMNGILAVTFMPQKKGLDQGACLYFGPDISSENLKQLVDGISDEVGMTGETSNECAGDRSIEPQHNQIVIAVVDGEYTIKRLYRKNGGVELRSENPAFKPICFKAESQLEIWGVVVGVVRRYV